MLTWTLTLHARSWCSSVQPVHVAHAGNLPPGTAPRGRSPSPSVNFRTPLTSFSLYTEMLEDGMVPEQKKPEYYANMQRECRRLEHLIENVLSYSPASAERYSPRAGHAHLSRAF